jgi:aminopeptidase N
VKKLLSFLIFLVSPLLSFSQDFNFTREDSLRGTITKERKWWDLKFYHLDIEVEPLKKFIAGSVTINYAVIEPYQTLQVDLQAPLSISKITQDDDELTFQKASVNVYIISLKKHQEKGTNQSIKIFYEGIPAEAKNPPWQGGVQWASTKEGEPFIATSCQGLGASVWWPCKDHMYDEPDSMLMSVTVPEDLMDVSNGRLRRVSTRKPGTKTYEWFVSNPINNYGVNINIANYVHYTDTLHGEKGILDLDFYVLPYNLTKAKEQFKQVKLMLKAFEHWFGPYPFYEDGYKLVEVPYLGMEHQSSITYGNEYSNGYRGKDLSGTGWGLKWDFIIIHESGHEWFANNITYRDIADMWIHESFTNYSESLYIDYYFGKEAATDYVVGTRQHIKNDIPIVGPYEVNRRGSGDMYSKGGNMLHTIRHSIGNDSLFREILRGLNSTFYHQTVTTQQMENYISMKSGIDFSKIFDQYLRSIKIPQFEYYVKKRKLWYRWSNVVDGFNLQLNLAGSNGNIVVLKPTTEWKNVTIKKRDDFFSPAYLERMYYIKAVSTSPSNQVE